MTDNNQKLADALVSAYRTGSLLAYEEAVSLAPNSDEDAYQVQTLVAEALGWFGADERFIWKTGGNLQAPTAARVRQDVVTYHSPNTGRFSVYPLDMRQAHDFTSIEVEIAVKLAKPIPSGASLAELEGAIDRVFLSIEVCDQRAERWSDLPSRVRLADQQMNRAIVLVGEPINGWQDHLVRPQMSITVNQQQIAAGEGAHPLGHPLALLPWLSELSRALFSRGLEAGDIVTTGAWFGLQMLTEGDEVTASIEGLGEVCLHLLS